MMGFEDASPSDTGTGFFLGGLFQEKKVEEYHVSTRCRVKALLNYEERLVSRRPETKWRR